MRLTILAIGRDRDPEIEALVARYTSRSPWPVTVHAVEAKRPGGREAEAKRLLAAVPDGATLVALDEAGTDLASRTLAEQLADWRDDGVRDVVFAIGGPDGHGPHIAQRAALQWRLGRATWPHMLVRVMVAEQLYRAQTILTGHPYHRD
jgi:23S rRNA (pseudouridine1915-N3)-methyltransferase